jgi:putative ABC transport system ATP-binding protein/lipoprotein-releasing system ATP-binding protein
MSLKTQGITKSFGDPPIQIIKPMDIHIENGDFVSITGRSGSGKTTLLYLLSSLDLPTTGTVWIEDNDIRQMNQIELHKFRCEKIGFIFQFHYLLPELTALENVLLPARAIGIQREKTKEAEELLKKFDVFSERDKLPSKMSGGQQQRVAVARSLIMKPRYLFADEPTGNLDSFSSKVVMNFLKEVNEKTGTTIVLVTHDEAYAKMASRTIFLVDGKIVDEKDY